MDSLPRDRSGGDERAAIEGVGGRSESWAELAAETPAALSAGGALHAGPRSEMARQACRAFRPAIAPCASAPHASTSSHESLRFLMILRAYAHARLVWRGSLTPKSFSPSSATGFYIKD